MADKKTQDGQAKNPQLAVKIIKRIVIGAIITILVFGSFFVVGAGEKGVIFNVFSGVKDKTYDEGLHFKLPFFEKAYKFEVRTRVYNDDAAAASKDLQIVSTSVALNYHIDKDKVNTLFKNIGPDY